MRRFRMSLSLGLLVYCSVWASMASAAASPEEVLEFLYSAYRHNQDLITQVQGSAAFRWHRDVYDEEMKAKGIDGGDWEGHVQWWSSGDRYRADWTPLSDKENVFGDGRSTKVVSSPENRIHFNQWLNDDGSPKIEQVVIQEKWPDNGMSPRLIPGNYYFNPQEFFKVDGWTPKDFVERHAKQGFTFTTDEDTKNGEFTIRGEGQTTSSGPRCYEIVISAKLGYNVTKVVMYEKGKEENPLFLFQAQYSAWNLQDATYYPVTYQFTLGEVKRRFREVVSVEFSEVQLNVPIDEAVFTLDGLGVPRGTPMYDYLLRDEANQPLKSYYGGLPTPKYDKMADEALATLLEVNREQILPRVDSGATAQEAPSASGADSSRDAAEHQPSQAGNATSIRVIAALVGTLIFVSVLFFIRRSRGVSKHA